MKSKIQYSVSVLPFPFLVSVLPFPFLMRIFWMSLHHVIWFHTSKSCFQFCAVVNAVPSKDIVNEYQFVERSIKFGKCAEYYLFPWNNRHIFFSVQFLPPDKMNKKKMKWSRLGWLTQLWCENLQGLVKFINSRITMRAHSSHPKPFNYTLKFWIIFASSKFQIHLSFGYKVHPVKQSDLLQCLFSWEGALQKAFLQNNSPAELALLPGSRKATSSFYAKWYLKGHTLS